MNQTLAYKAIFRNDWGESETLLCRDGLDFSFEAWGVTFEASTDFSFQPVDKTDVTKLGKFILTGLTLANYTLDFDLPVRVLTDGEIVEANIRAQLKLGLPVERWKCDRELVLLKLDYRGASFCSSEKNGNDFYDALVEIKSQMSAADELMICFFCQNHFGREAHVLENFLCDYVSKQWVLATDSCPKFIKRTTPI